MGGRHQGGSCPSPDNLLCCPEAPSAGPIPLLPLGSSLVAASQSFLGRLVLGQDSFSSVFCVFISQWLLEHVPFMMALERGGHWALGWGTADRV